MRSGDKKRVRVQVPEGSDGRHSDRHSSSTSVDVDHRRKQNKEEGECFRGIHPKKEYRDGTRNSNGVQDRGERREGTSGWIGHSYGMPPGMPPEWRHPASRSIESVEGSTNRMAPWIQEQRHLNSSWPGDARRSEFQGRYNPEQREHMSREEDRPIYSMPRQRELMEAFTQAVKDAPDESVWNMRPWQYNKLRGDMMTYFAEHTNDGRTIERSKLSRDETEIALTWIERTEEYEKNGCIHNH